MANEVYALWQEIGLRSSRLLLDAWQRAVHPERWVVTDELGLAEAFTRLAARSWADPLRLFEHQARLWQDSLALGRHTLRRLAGALPAPVIAPDKTDRRFKDPAWHDSPWLDWIKQSYLLYARYWLGSVTAVEGLDPQTARKVEFYTRQWVDALAPTNFALTNPEVLHEAARTGGMSLLRGWRNWLVDLERGNGRLAVRMTDMEAFRLGENIAVTPGKVVFRNELMELLQYRPLTGQVRRRPVLIVPPWINKFYIMDLRPRNSFIRWLVEEGHTVFVISWVNPTAGFAQKSFDDYLRDGPLAALGAVERATGEREVNAIGYCLGGTLLACTLAYLAQVNDNRIQSATLLTTLLDFSEPGELGVFIDEGQVSALEKRMERQGFLDGSEMALTFSLLRANDLIWSFFISNYLLGKDPVPFDLLYWNADSTRMPAKMHSFYLRKLYLENRLVEPGGMQLDGQPMDLSKVRVPVYFLSTLDDHIAPWKSTYAGARRLSGPVRFVLGESGHIAGVINPPAADKYGYWVNGGLGTDAGQWLRDAERRSGSWWRDWESWITGLDERGWVEARVPGEGGLPALEDAPGSYVRYRLL